jgi:hypothetical protein
LYSDYPNSFKFFSRVLDQYWDIAIFAALARQP